MRPIGKKKKPASQKAVPKNLSMILKQWQAIDRQAINEGITRSALLWKAFSQYMEGVKNGD